MPNVYADGFSDLAGLRVFQNAVEKPRAHWSTSACAGLLGDHTPLQDTRPTKRNPDCMYSRSRRLPPVTNPDSKPGGPNRRSCQQLHRHLASGAAGDCSLSGTTLCAAVLTGRRLTVANVGDSGCLRLSRRTTLDASGKPSPGAAAAAAAAASASALAPTPTKKSCLAIGGGDDETAAADGSEGSPRGTLRRVNNAGPPGSEETRASGRGGSGGSLVAERLSRDHKPEGKGERERIHASGGVVFPLPRGDGAGDAGGERGEGGVAGESLSPAETSKWGRQRAADAKGQGFAAARDFRAEVPRVWTASGEGPGLAMSRSIGDKVRMRLSETCSVPRCLRARHLWKSFHVDFLGLFPSALAKVV